MKNLLLYICASMLLLSCSKDDPNNKAIETSTEQGIENGYQVKDGLILFNNQNIQPKGVNALNSFGIRKDGLLEEWNVSIVREFIGNLREQPITGFAIQDAQTKFLHSLDSIVINHREKNRITILCPFGWVDELGEQTLFTGKNPREMVFYADYKAKMKQIAEHFKGKTDVWIQVWNEPYHFNNENNYSHELWLADHKDMVANLRNVDGFTNIILIAGNEQGQGETVLLEKGDNLLELHNNLLFDLHAYGKWNENSTVAGITERLSLLQQKQIPFLFGEVGVITEGAPLSDPKNLLKVCNDLNIGALAWLWNRNTTDQNSLLTDEGAPNNVNNLNWGGTFKSFLSGD